MIMILATIAALASRVSTHLILILDVSSFVQQLLDLINTASFGCVQQLLALPVTFSHPCAHCSDSLKQALSSGSNFSGATCVHVV
jgi:hypothetical protein